MTDSDLIQYLKGEVVALTALVTVLAETHPDRTQLAAAFEQRCQAVLATTEPAPVREAYLDGLKAAIESLRAIG